MFPRVILFLVTALIRVFIVAAVVVVVITLNFKRSYRTTNNKTK